MTQPEQEAREMLLEVLSYDPMIEQIRKGYVQPYLVSWDDTIKAMLAFAARPTAGIDREDLGRLIDPDAWHETLPTDGCGTYWMSRRYNARQKADAILALTATSAKTAPVATAAKTGERGAVIEECARVVDLMAARARAIAEERYAAAAPITEVDHAMAAHLAYEAAAKAIRALPQPLPDAPIVGGEGYL